MFDNPVQLDNPDLELPEMPACDTFALDSMIGLLKDLNSDVAELRAFYQELNPRSTQQS